jgi:hypothetical protein
LQTGIQIEPKSGAQSCELKARVIQGKLREIILALRGDGEVGQVTGTELKDWSVRVDAQGKRFLVIRPIEPATNAPPLTNFAVTVSARHKFEKLPAVYAPLNFLPENAAFSDRHRRPVNYQFDGLIGPQCRNARCS